TTLAIRKADMPGLNLTRASLDAILKYPRFRLLPATPHAKFGAYRSETACFDFARELHPVGDERKSVEAEIMDWADDIGYAVHDLEDFYRAGLIPLDRIMSADEKERGRFLST